MADAPPPLDYADPCRRSRRRLRLIALVAGAIACGVVGRLLYSRLAPLLQARMELIAAQREIDGLNAPGASYAVNGRAEATSSTQPSRLETAVRAYLGLRGQLFVANVPIFAGRLVNGAGDERIVLVRAIRSRSTIGQSISKNVATLIVDVAHPVSVFASDAARRTDVLSLLETYGSLRIEPPSIDRSNRRRLLLHGTIDGNPFAHELTLDAGDRAHLAPIDVPPTQPSPK